jgi:hypothetical protein
LPRPQSIFDEINQNTFVAAENLLHTDNALDVFFKIIFADFDFHRVVSLRVIIFGTVNEVIDTISGAQIDLADIGGNTVTRSPQ